MLDQTFGKGNAIILDLPPRDLVGSDDVMIGEFTVFASGATESIKAAFAGRREYWVPRDRPTDQKTPNGFTASPGEGWMQFRPSTIVVSGPRGPLSTDAWPFLYLQRPMIPQLILGMAIMGVIGALFLVPFLNGASGQRLLSPGRQGLGRLLRCSCSAPVSSDRNEGGRAHGAAVWR